MDATNMEPSLVVAQRLGSKAAYHVGELLKVTGSRATAYRVLDRLFELGWAEPLNRGFFAMKSSVFQPYWMWPHLASSLQSLKHARYFGRTYGEGDVRFARRTIAGAMTLDYRAYDLTRLQTPHTLYLYVDDLDRAARQLREKGFSEGKAGRAAIVPRFGSFDREIERVYLDCLAAGGRNTLDAIAIELLYSDKLTIHGVFRADMVSKVKEEVPVGAR
ncbi:MAG: hypothetical protein KGI38_10490 [Thaumarchaeota archaeon]|nr:hypothetical protein [Nitrososphaerota archaeon]